jgi:outer membrane lipoprotein-sorting protein
VRRSMVADVTHSNLVSLMFQPTWPQASISAEVKSRLHGAGPDSPRGQNGSLRLAPLGCYRADLLDEDGERTLTICDGTTTWVITDMSADIVREPLRVPFSKLLNPAWILANFDFDVIGETQSLGRTAYAIAGSRRDTSRSRKTLDNPADRVSALIDADLGILLRYETTGPGARSERAEFAALRLISPQESDPAWFAPPVDIEFTEHRPDEHNHPHATPAAGHALSSLSNSEINVINRSDMGSQVFSAQLHEWANGDEIADSITASIPDSAPKWISQIDKLSSRSAPGILDLTARLQVAMPGRYKIEVAGEPASRRPVCVSCDGEHVWRVFGDRATVGPTEVPPAGIALLIDPAWLLCGYQLSSEGATTVSGRSALQIVAQRTDDAPLEREQGPLSSLSLLADRIETTIDLRLGVALRQIWYLNGKPLLRTSLDELSEHVDDASFRIDPPPGLRVIQNSNPFGDILPAAVKEIGQAASRFADGIGRVIRRR